MTQYCIPLNLLDWTPDGQAATGHTNWLRDQILDVISMYAFVWKMHFSGKSVKRIGRKWSCVQKIPSALLMDSPDLWQQCIHVVTFNDVF